MHVVVANGARVHALPWMRVHVSRRIVEADLHPSRRPRQVRAARAVIDSAAWKSSPRLACALVAAAVQQRIATPEQLAQELSGAGMVRHRRVLASALQDIAGGSQALSEIDFVRICRKAGLPKPEQQVVRRDRDGRRRYLDARIRRPDGRVILVEVDGAMHLIVSRWWDDQSRSNDLVIEDGAIMLRFPAAVLRTDEPRVIDQLQRAYFGTDAPAWRRVRPGALSA